MKTGVEVEQAALPFNANRRGGKRRGAGRRPRAWGDRHTPHRARPVHRAAHPVHVTLRAALRSLRSQHLSKTVLGALRQSNRSSFRIVHYSIQHNHLHLVVEADDTASLSRGMRGVAVRIARRVNQLLFRRGRFWADRWHGQPLTSPRQVRNALVYVLQNHRKHSAVALGPALDPLSSAEWFDGFAEFLPAGFRSIGPPAIRASQTWLLRSGWLRHGRIRLAESPRAL